LPALDLYTPTRPIQQRVADRLSAQGGEHFAAQQKKTLHPLIDYSGLPETARAVER